MSFMPSSNIWDSKGVVFIVRGRDNIQFESIRERDLPDTTSQEILKDEEVRLTGVETASKFPKKTVAKVNNLTILLARLS